MRTEDVYIKLRLPEGTPKKYRKIAGKIAAVTINNDDSLSLTYNLDISYYGKTDERLQTILKLARAGYVTDANLRELRYKLCLIQEVVLEIEKFRKK